MSIPASSTSSPSVSFRSARPPPNISVNMAWKLARIFSKVSTNRVLVSVLIRLMTSINSVLALIKSSYWACKNV